MASPKLRFKEFDGDWSKYKIAETTEYLVDGTHFSPKSTEGEFKYITSKNIRNDGLDLSNLSYISKEEHDVIFKRCKVQFGDILLTKDGANTGNCCLNTLDEEFSLLSSVAVLRSKQGHFDNKFLLQILQSDIGQNTITSSMAGQAITRITLAKLKDYSFHFPLYKEQTKIASFLSAVDEKISQLTQKHELLSQYKQGMMQKLFSQQIRFKADDGSEFGEWEETTLGDIVKIRSGYSPSKYDLKNKGSIPFLKVEELNNCIKFQKNSRFYTKNIESDLIVKNSIIFPKRGAAILYNKVRILSVDSLLDSNLMALIPSESIFYEYLYYVITFIELFKIADTSSIPQINNKHIEPYSIDLPSLEEQTKIANFLSAIDQKIEVVAQQIEQAKQWKKGLLQQMFV